MHQCSPGPEGDVETDPEVIKLFPCSTQLSTKFILLTNVKMPTLVGILTFIRKINTTSERLRGRNFFICRYLSFYEHLKFHAQLSWAWKKLFYLGAWSAIVLYECQWYLEVWCTCTKPSIHNKAHFLINNVTSIFIFYFVLQLFIYFQFCY